MKPLTNLRALDNPLKVAGMSPPASSDLLIVAIDPGVNGGVAWRWEGKTYAVKMPPTDFDCVALLASLAELTTWVELYLEEPPLYAGKNIPGSAIGKLMFNTGVLYGAAIALRFKVHRVRPAIWMKSHPVGTKGELTTTEWKNKLKARASELYPDGVAVTLWSADALLILDAAVRRAIT